ncbi:hypothetical protein HHI36_000143 [Cryptolaemus montrouzieri]|uniref:rRNA biogenesis protein RRP36 n=1 Tax=Cryptolaemus montrouzieri TaxID=559131 RepID=A0ABD2P3W1_9CUCU
MSSENEFESDNVSSSSEEDENLLKSDLDRIQVREKLSTMSFEDIQKLKEKIGSKLYNETVFDTKKRKSQTTFKRENKNRPREMSSKIRIKVKNSVNVAKKPTPRDPRFDSLCGEYDEKSFKTNYKFINTLRKKEKKELEDELENTTDFDRKKQIKYLLQRMDNQIREHEKKEKLEQQKLEEKREMRLQLQRGEKPVYKRKSEKKLVISYKNMKN